MKCILLRFPTYVIGSSLAEIVKIENTVISNKNDMDRLSDCEVRRAGKTLHPIKFDWLLIDCVVRRAGKTLHPIKFDWLLICFFFVTKSPGFTPFKILKNTKFTCTYIFHEFFLKTGFRGFFISEYFRDS